jgi:hypothetical protein
MTDRKLMQQALDALEYASDQTKPENLHGCDCLICTTILALREKLAQPEQEHTGFMDSKINPIRRQWVGLTEPERFACYDLNPARFASAIEAKLKEKNK